MAGLYNTNTTANIRIAKANYPQNQNVFVDNNITDVISLRFYGNGDDLNWKTIADFVNSQLKEILKTERTMKMITQPGKMFVKFFIQSCHYCQQVKATWKALEDAYENDSELTVGNVDCNRFPALCDKFDVSHYPSMLYIEDGKRKEKFSGSRTLKNFKTYLDLRLGRIFTRSRRSTEQGSVLDLDTTNFYESVAEGITLVKFYVNWCKHCKAMEGTWDQLATYFSNDTSVKIAQVLGGRKDTKQLFSDERTNGVPHINLYVNGTRKLTDHYDDLTFDGLVDCIESFKIGGSEIRKWKKRAEEKEKFRAAERRQLRKLLRMASKQT